MVEANMDDDYEIPSHEQHLIHVTIEDNDKFDPKTGQRKGTPLVQSFYPKDFERMEKANAFKGKSVNIIHDPSNAEDRKKHKDALDYTNTLDVNGQDTEKSKTVKQGKKGKDEEKKAPKSTAAQLAKQYKDAAAKYKELYNEDPTTDATIEDLNEAIQSKLDEKE